MPAALVAVSLAFQSTPSAWRETGNLSPDPDSSCLISIHSLRMEGDETLLIVKKKIDISIHSLRMEGDKSPVTISWLG